MKGGGGVSFYFLSCHSLTRRKNSAGNWNRRGEEPLQGWSELASSHSRGFLPASCLLPMGAHSVWSAWMCMNSKRVPTHRSNTRWSPPPRVTAGICGPARSICDLGLVWSGLLGDHLRLKFQFLYFSFSAYTSEKGAQMYACHHTRVDPRVTGRRARSRSETWRRPDQEWSNAILKFLGA